MSDYSIINDINNTLIYLLWTNFESDSQINPDIISSSNQIILDSPADMEQDQRLSLFLFRISENPFMKNQDMQKVNSTRLAYPPCTVDLNYMITPRTQNRTNDHIVLGKIIQIFHDHGTLKDEDLQGNLAGSTEELRLVLSPLSIEDMTQLWNLFRERSYMLSLCYQVTPVKIDSTREIEARRIVERELGYYQMRFTK